MYHQVFHNPNQYIILIYDISYDKIYKSKKKIFSFVPLRYPIFQLTIDHKTLKYRTISALTK